MFFQSSLGIQVEKNQVAMAFLKTSLRGARLAASDVRPIDADAPLKERVKDVAERVREFSGHYNASPVNVIVGLPRESVILRNISLPWAVKENLRATLSYEMEKYCPFTADDIYFDYQIIKEDKKTNALEILLGVAKRDEVSPYFALKDLLGKGLSGIGISSVAIVNGLFDFYPNLMNQPFKLIYLAEDYFEVDSITEATLFSSRVFRNPTEIHGRVDMLVKSLEQAQWPPGSGSNSTDVMLCGPGANEQISGGLKEKGVHVVDLESAKGNIPSQALMPAFGLALSGLKPMPVQPNLLPREFQKRPTRIPYYLMIFLLFMALLAGMAWWGSGVFQRKIAYEKLNSEVGRLRSEAGKVEDLRRECDSVKKSLDDLRSATALNAPLLSILKELTTRIPQDAWLTEFSFANGKVTIAGSADKASELIPLLEASPLFLDVGFLSTIRKTREGREQFRIGLKVG